MYLHFEDWSDTIYIDWLNTKRLPHANRIIKVFASDIEPSQALGRSALTIVESDDTPFTHADGYSYPRRAGYSGPQLEDRLKSYGLRDIGRRTLRSLFRFSNEQGFCQQAMAATKGYNQWLIRHPFDHIDGVTIATKKPLRERAIHMDIFFPDSVQQLRQLVDLENPDTLLSKREGLSFIQQQWLNDGAP